MGQISSVLENGPCALLPGSLESLLVGSPEAAGGREGISEIVFLGTGSSAGTPMISCVVNPDSDCVACRSAIRDGPRSKNTRGNPSLLIRYRGSASSDGESSGHQNIIIDCGKTFKASIMRIFPGIQERKIDALVITHEHADAMLGLDDVREISAWGKNWRQTMETQPALPVHLSPACMRHVERVFPYLCTKPDESKGEVVRMVSQLNFNVVREDAPSFSVGGLEISALPVLHGADCVCYGYDFGVAERVVYISDVTEIPDATMEKIRARPVHVLVLDSLLWDRDAATHIGCLTAVKIAREIQPKHVLLTGMSHSQGDHDEVNAKLREITKDDPFDVAFAFDGQRIPIRL